MKISNIIKAAMSVFSPPNILQPYDRDHRASFGDLGLSCDEFSLSDIQCFINLIMEDEIIQQFLEFDCCYKLADKYLISQAFVYFIRARLVHSQYNRINFFAALYLAHDIEEEDDDLKTHVARWGLPRLHKNNLDYFLAVRDSLWISMDLRASVSVECCFQVMKSAVDCPLWKRDRNPVHGGAFRAYIPDEECGNCRPKKTSFLNTTDSSDYGDESCYDQDHKMFPPPAKRLRLEEE